MCPEIVGTLSDIKVLYSLKKSFDSSRDIAAYQFYRIHEACASETRIDEW